MGIITPFPNHIAGPLLLDTNYPLTNKKRLPILLAVKKSLYQNNIIEKR
jgi:hypothetical protein